MQHVVYFEPDYDRSRPNLWQLRGQYKYPSILGALRAKARVSLLMGVVPPRTDPMRKQLEAEYGVEFRHVSLPDVPGKYFGPMVIQSLQRAIERLQPTVFSNLNGRAIKYCHISARVAELLGIRYVMRVGGDDLATKDAVYTKEGRPFTGTTVYADLVRQERIALECAAAVIAMSERERQRLILQTYDAGKVHICYRGVDTGIFRAVKPKSGPLRRVLFIGRQSAEKGYDLAESAARLLHEQGSDIRFTFAGTFKPSRVDNREYRGFVAIADLPALYAEHDALVVCSRAEGFPQVLMEAMAMGLPCVISKHLFHHDFDHGRTALLCGLDAFDVAACLHELRTDIQLYRSLSANSLAHAQMTFDQDMARERYHRILLAD